jgi:hypothetical protein
MPPQSWILQSPDALYIMRPSDSWMTARLRACFAGLARRSEARRREESPGSTERRCRLTAGGGDPRESATEKTPPTGPVFSGRLAAARLKWCGKSAPRSWQQERHGKPHREQDQIGTARDVFRIAVRVGRARCVATHIPEEWSSPRKWYRTRLTGCLTFLSPHLSSSGQAFGRHLPRQWLRHAGKKASTKTHQALRAEGRLTSDVSRRLGPTSSPALRWRLNPPFEGGSK